VRVNVTCDCNRTGVSDVILDEVVQMGGGERNPITRSRLSLTRLDGRELPSVALPEVTDWQIPMLPELNPANQVVVDGEPDEGTDGGPPGGGTPPPASQPPAPKSGDPSDEHKKDLGTDPAAGKYRENEAETALRVEAEKKVKLKRFQPTSEKTKGDWIDQQGLIYDGCSSAPKAFFDNQLENWKKQVQDHIAKVDRTVVDVTGLGLTEEQTKKVTDFIESLPEADKKEVIFIGTK
jgi:hypothetical protein